MEKKNHFILLIKQLVTIAWKLLLMLLLTTGRIIIMAISIMNTKIEDYLKVPKKNL